MKFKLVEAFLYSVNEGIEDSGFTVLPNTIKACRDVIKAYYLNPKTTRGAKQARDIIISKYNDKYKTTLNSDDYVFHHRNGIHTIDDFRNAVLLRKSTIKHRTLHTDIIKAVILRYAASKGYRTGSSIPPSIFTHMTIIEQYRLLDLYLQLSELKTDRVKNKASTIDVIYASDL